MKKYFYLATVALMSVALASCEKKPEPTPDPEPQPTDNVVEVSIKALTISDYYEDYGLYSLIMAGTDAKDVAYYAQIFIAPETAGIAGSYSIAEKTIDSEYSAFLIGYTENSTEDDLVTPDTMSITLKANGTNYDISGEVVYKGITYQLSATNIEAIDEAWQYEPTTATTINQTYTAFEGIDYTADYQTVSILLDNEETFVSLEIVADSALAAGTYPINNTQELGTVLASEGYNTAYEYDTPSFLGVYTDENGYYDETYYLVGGEVVVAYPKEGTISIQGNATSHFGSTITFSYEGAYEWSADEEEDYAPAAAPKKLAAKKTVNAKKLTHKALGHYSTNK